MAEFPSTTQSTSELLLAAQSASYRSKAFLFGERAHFPVEHRDRVDAVFEVNASRMIKFAAALYPAYLRGSCLDELLLLEAGRSPALLDEIAGKVVMRRDFHFNHTYNPFLPADDQIHKPRNPDIFVVAGSDSLVDLETAIREHILGSDDDKVEVSELYGGHWDQEAVERAWRELQPGYQRLLTLDRIPENERVKILRYLATRTRLSERRGVYGLHRDELASLNFTAHHLEAAQADNRMPNRCSNIDGLAALLRVQGIDPQSVTLLEDLDRVAVEILVPRLPSSVRFPDEAYEFYQQGIAAGDVDIMVAFIEQVVRSARKSLTLDVPFAEATIEQVSALMERMRPVIEHVYRDPRAIVKDFREVEVCSVIDASRAKQLLRSLGVVSVLSRLVGFYRRHEDRNVQAERLMREIFV